MRFLRALLASLGCLLIILWDLYVAAPAFASSSWSQTDWSGGSGQTSFSTANKYSSGGNVISSTANQITLSKQNVGNTGTGNDGAITVASNKNINTDNMISGRSCADGGDAVNYTVTTSIATGSGTITLSSTPSSGCLAAGDEIIIINLEGTSSDNANVGKYETATVGSISSATISLASTLANTYDGTTQKIMVQRVPNYTSVTINGSTTLTASAWNGTKGGVLFFRATGTVTVTGTISVNSLGYRGGTNTANGESYDGTVGAGGAIGSAGTNGGGSGSGDTSASPQGTRGGGGASGAVNSGGDQGAGGGAGGGYGGGGGGGGGGADCNATAGTGGLGGGTGVSAGGGGGGMWNGSCNLPGNGGNAGNAGGGANGSNASAGGAVGSGSTTGGGGGGGRGDGPGGVGGVGSGGGGGGGTYGSSDLSTLFFGSGGGGGNMSGNNGQIGGGIISISADTLTNSGSITSNGADATSASSESGAGGAGAGGSILLSANTLTIGSGTVTASGGAKSNGTVKGGGGGGGGVGRIAAYSANSISGTSTPTYATATSSYQTSGSLTSSIFDTTYSTVSWGTLTYSATTPTNTSVSVKVRTGNQSNMSDATAFSSCTAIASGTSIANTSCVSSSNRYVQYQVTISTSDTSSTPTFTSFSLIYDQQASSSSASSSSSSSANPGVSCTSVSSGGPNLYEIDPSSSSVTLYFIPISNADTYSISYGQKTSADTYSASLSDSDHSGAVKYAINSLDSNTTYYFKVRGANGCSSSSWSNVMASTTKSTNSNTADIVSNIASTSQTVFAPSKKLDIVSSKLTDNVTPTPAHSVPHSDVSRTSLDVKVLGIDNKPLAGVLVTLHSNVQTAKTDAQGIARFANVEKGNHKVILAYNGYTGDQALTVDGNKKSQTLTMQVKLSNGPPWGVFFGITAVLICVIVMLVFIIFKRNKK